MNRSLHTIRKQTLQFQYNGNADGFALQKEVGEWCNFNLIPEIEQQLDLLDLDDNYFTIDKLEIEATAGNHDWQQKIRDELIYSLKRKLNSFETKFTEKESNKSVNRTRKLDELILYYFENGYLPWWGNALITDNFETVLQSWIRNEMPQTRADFIRSELKQIASKPLLDRIINQIPHELFFQLLKNIYKQEPEIIGYTESFFKEIIVGNTPPARQKAITKAFYSFLLIMIIENEGTIETGLVAQFVYEELMKTKTSPLLLQPVSGKIDKTANPVKSAWQQLLFQELKKQESSFQIQPHPEEVTLTPPEINPEEEDSDEITQKEKRFRYNKLIDKLTNPDFVKKSQDERTAELQEGIYIDNAGAVIFAAFIPGLFSQLKLVNDGTINNPDLAAMIIQYCVTGNAKIAEYELVLPKILCGLPTEYPVNTNTKITAGEMKEVDEMLQSLIEYWSVLKNTSVDGLRESFFKRNGKLSLMKTEWLLQVEQRPYDMLLQQLPWSMSMIKFPWMKNLLRTEWV
jgi:hypothetical protein